MEHRNNPLRILAKSNRWQVLYNRAKELGGLRLFKNEYNFSDLQIEFLRWLNIYNILYEDMAMEEPFIDQDIIDNEILTDCYLYYRKDKNKKESKKDKQKGTTTDSLVFNNRK